MFALNSCFSPTIFGSTFKQVAYSDRVELQVNAWFTIMILVPRVSQASIFHWSNSIPNVGLLTVMQHWNRNWVYSSVTPTLVTLHWCQLHIMNQGLILFFSSKLLLKQAVKLTPMVCQGTQKMMPLRVSVVAMEIFDLYFLNYVYLKNSIHCWNLLFECVSGCQNLPNNIKIL